MSKHIRALELDKVLELLAEQATCEDSRKACLAMLPIDNYPRVVRGMGFTSDLHSLTARFGTPTVLGMKNCLNSVKRTTLGGTLTTRELLQIEGVLKAFKNLNQWFNHFKDEEHSITELFSTIQPIRNLEKAINSSVISEDEIADTASPTLGDIRRKIASAGNRIRSQLDSMIKSTTYQKYLQDNIITIRDGRFVVPVKAEHKNEIKGLVHDTSSSGATLFVEPMAVVEANNEIRVLKSKEAEEIQIILENLSIMVSENAEAIQVGYEAAVEADVLLSKARLAYKMNATVPEITNDGIIYLNKARHPLIDKAKAVPINIYLGDEFDTLVITGPNTGGKTVSIKTLGLLTLMAMCGLMVPTGDGSKISVFSQVLADIGDEQSIEQSLSTFSGHMTNIVSILDSADDRTLVLMDELGAGTDPTEGAALAVAIIEELRAKGAKIGATTHYTEMKMYALETPGVENGSCEFDIATLSPTYKLLIGVPGRSNAFAISSRLGLDNGVIDRAKELVSGEATKFEDVVTKLEGERKEMEDAKKQARIHQQEIAMLRADMDKQIERLERDKENDLQRARDQARAIVDSVTKESQRLLDELEEIKRSKDKEDFSLNVNTAKGQFKANLRKLEELADPVTGRMNKNYTPPRPFVRGDNVRVADINKDGVLMSNPDQNGNVTVMIGSMKMKLNVSSLRLSQSSGKNTSFNGKSISTRGGVSTKGITSARERSTKQEINLLGMTSDEAIMELDRFIDSAVMSHYNIVYIIHGKGTGVLRKAVQAHLKRHRSVRTFRLGTYGEGESGVTVAELK